MKTKTFRITLVCPASARADRTCAFERLESRCLLSAGDLVAAFGDHGMINHSSAAGVVQMATQPQTGGKTYVLVADAHGIARLRPNGSTDTRFGGGRVGVGKKNFIQAIAVQSDGKILVAGTVGAAPGASANTTFIEQLTPSGRPDRTFGTSGTITLPGVPAQPSFYVNQLLVRPDGRIVAPGVYRGTAPYPFVHASYTAVTQLNADGSSDTGFASGGTLVLPDNNDETFTGRAVLEQDGTLLVAGFEGLDATFGETLEISTAGVPGAKTFNSPLGGHLGVAARPDGSVALATVGPTIGISFDNGATVTPFAYNTSLPVSLGRQIVALPDNSMVIAAGGYNAVAVARLRPDASPDPTFGSGGTAATHVSSKPNAKNFAVTMTGLVTLPDGTVIVGGTYKNHRLLVAFSG